MVNEPSKSCRSQSNISLYVTDPKRGSDNMDFATIRLPRRAFIAIVLCLLTSAGWAQTCPEETHVLTTQAEVDAFPADCTHIAGHLNILGGQTTLDSQRIVSLAALENLQSVELLSITGTTALESLEGLGSLSSVSGGNNTIASTRITSNTALKSLEGLHNLLTLDAGLSISSNPLLTSLEGLRSLQHIDKGIGRGELSISNSALRDLTGFDSLETAPSISIKQNNQLESLTGMPLLTEIDYIGISENPLLRSLSHLSAIKPYGGVYISRNNSLEDLSGLESVISVWDFVTITANEKLADISALSNLRWVGGNVSLLGTTNYLISDFSPLSSLEHVGGRLRIASAQPAWLIPLAGLLGWPDKTGESAHVGTVQFEQRWVNSGFDPMAFTAADVLNLVESVPTVEILSTEVSSREATFTLTAAASNSQFIVGGYKASCIGKVVVGSYSTTETISDGMALEIPINLNGDFLIGSDGIRLAIDLDHENLREVSLKLRSPRGTEVLLAPIQSYSVSSSITRFGTPVIFPDTSLPRQPLSVFGGEEVDGQWTLIIEDKFDGDQGTLTEVILEVTDIKRGEAALTEVTVKSLSNGQPYQCYASPELNMAHEPQSEEVFLRPQASREDIIGGRVRNLMESLSSTRSR